MSEITDISELWTEDLVTFLLMCGFTADPALITAGIPVRHVEDSSAGAAYRSNIECRAAGRFNGPLVVSVLPLTPRDAIRATEITSRFKASHGAPVHIGDPRAIGIEDLARPDYGDAMAFRKGEIPVFWACGITAEAAAVSTKPDLMITHAPGHMFIASVTEEQVPV